MILIDCCWSLVWGRNPVSILVLCRLPLILDMVFYCGFTVYPDFIDCYGRPVQTGQSPAKLLCGHEHHRTLIPSLSGQGYPACVHCISIVIQLLFPAGKPISCMQQWSGVVELQYPVGMAVSSSGCVCRQGAEGIRAVHAQYGALSCWWS